MNDENKNVLRGLAEWSREVLDVNGDGMVSFKDLLALFPNSAVGIAIVVLDLLVAVAEYRVWDVGLTITGSPWKAAGFVAVSALPFYLGQLLWLYPLANAWQQFIGGVFVLVSLFTSVNFSLADLNQRYDVTQINQAVAWMTGVYVLGLILYILVDQRIQDRRLVTKTRARARYQMEIAKVSDEVLGVLEESLAERTILIQKYGPDAVQAQLERMKRGKTGGKLFPVPQPQPVPVPVPQPRPQPKPQQQEQYPVWTLGDLAERLEMSVAEFQKLCVGKTVDQAYQAMKGHKIENVMISRKNFKRLVHEAQDGSPNG